MSVFFRNIVVFFTLLVCIAGSFSHVYVSSEVSEASYVDKFATGGLDGDVLGDDTKYSKQNVLKNTDIVDMGSDSVSVET
ncbi:MAG: hypothetical protein U9Q15_03995 [Patescibacteria group bacterium]|nr:hypothetical protein [Patescibacteria group bacterium]